MRHGSLFSGIGGFDLAAEWMGWENLFHCEWMPFPRKVLDYYWPNADSLTDICNTDFTQYNGRIDVLTGGFPCQPFSQAGKRKGKEDERYLWHEMLRAVREIKPRFIIAENVYGITNIDGGLVFEQVCSDLENEGYEVQPYIIPACGKDAPHRRYRVWFVAYARNESRRCAKGCTDKQGRELLQDKQERCALWSQDSGCCSERVTPNAESTGFAPCLERSRQEQFRRASLRNELSNSWENFPSQSPVCSGDDGLPSELDGITFSKWRAESIKGYGNAIVPQIAYELFKTFT